MFQPNSFIFLFLPRGRLGIPIAAHIHFTAHPDVQDPPHSDPPGCVGKSFPLPPFPFPEGRADLPVTARIYFTRRPQARQDAPLPGEHIPIVGGAPADPFTFSTPEGRAWVSP